MPPVTPDDDLTDEEIARFEGADPDEVKAIERFLKWQKAKVAGPKGSQEDPGKPGSLPGSQGGELTLSQIQKMIGDPTNASILRHLLAQADELAKLPASKGKGNVLPLKRKGFFTA